MSFTKTIKEELVTIPIETSEQLAEFAAFLHFNGEISIQNGQKKLSFKTNSPTVGKRFLQLSRTLYQAETQLFKKDQQKLTKKPQIYIDIMTKVDVILSEIKLLDPIFETSDVLLETEDTQIAFLRAAFLSTGSVNHPKTAQYHLEMSHDNTDLMILIQTLMNHFELNAKIIKRRHQTVVYIKDAEHITDFMMRLGAQNGVFMFEDIRIKRDFNNSINRVMNCEIANEKKAVITAEDQKQDIYTILHFNVHIPEKLKQIMDLRLKYEEANLRELAQLYEKEYHETISKSGLNHRFQKIKQLAQSLKEGVDL